MYFTSYLPNRWAAILLLTNLCLEMKIWAKALREMGLRCWDGFFHIFLVSSGRGRINFCPREFNHSIEYKCPEIISKVDAKNNLFLPCTSPGFLPACHRDVDLSGMDTLLSGKPTTGYADSSILPVTYKLKFLSMFPPISQPSMSIQGEIITTPLFRKRQISQRNTVSWLPQLEKKRRAKLKVLRLQEWSYPQIQLSICQTGHRNSQMGKDINLPR